MFTNFYYRHLSFFSVYCLSNYYKYGVQSETVTTEVIEKVCKALDAQPGEIMDYLDDNRIMNKY